MERASFGSRVLPNRRSTTAKMMRISGHPKVTSIALVQGGPALLGLALLRFGKNPAG